jgi:hypothetical protein
MRAAMFGLGYVRTVTAAEPVRDTLIAQAVGGTVHAPTSRLDAVDRVDV